MVEVSPLPGLTAVKRICLPWSAIDGGTPEALAAKAPNISPV